MISGSFWVWNIFIWASQGGGGVLWVSPRGKICLCFSSQISWYFSFRILGIISGTFRVWNIFKWASPVGSLSVTQGRNVFPLCFLGWIPLIFILGLWEWHLAHLEFEHFSSESTPWEGVINWVHWNLLRGTQQWSHGYNVLNLWAQGSYCISIQP